MTRKDYDVLSRAFSESRPNRADDDYGVRLEQWAQSVKHVCDALLVDNPRFNADTFKQRCIAFEPYREPARAGMWPGRDDDA